MGSQDTQRGCDCSCAWHGEEQPCGCPCPVHPDEPALGTSEARLAEAKEALVRIAHFPFDAMATPEQDVGAMKQIADDALAALSGDDTPAEQDPET